MTSPATPEGEQEEVLFQKTLESNPPKDIVLMTVEYAPGAGDSPHLHPGYAFVYVMAGEMVSQLDGQSKQVYRSGQSWFEQPYEHHVTCRNASTSKPAKILVFFLLEHGSKNTIDLPEAEHK
ncbi:MAG TPA: cupin domain-containing protein [Candidatus Binataceae bacterium]